MNKEEYKKSLHRHYPEEPDNVLELAWHFHGMEKAKKYIKLLETCNHNADLAIKAIRAMYVSCDIDAVKAVSEKIYYGFTAFHLYGKNSQAPFRDLPCAENAGRL